MKAYLAIVAALLAVGCSPQKTEKAAAAAAVADPKSADMGKLGAEPKDMPAADKMGMSEEDHAKMAADTSAPASAATGAGNLAMATGTVDKMDTAAGTITISHGAVESLNWPAMTMAFKATPDQIASVEPGQKVAFEFTSSGMDGTITSIKSQ